MSDKPKNKKAIALLAALLITEAIATSGSLTSIIEPPKKKKTWIEKQQAKRGWGDKW